jgi:NAD(P)-dependent dehydrogenase (short-subunit alcohol dehydrogenase family)
MPASEVEDRRPKKREMGVDQVKQLSGTVAMVTGASRGAGRGVAVELGVAGATVYVTGRSVRGQPSPVEYRSLLGAAGQQTMPGTIEDTAEEVTAAGGVGIAVRCDHRSEGEVRTLFARVAEEHGRLDVLVNNAWGGHESFTRESLDAPLWEQPLAHWESMFDHGVRNHVLSCREAAPLLIRQRSGLIVTTTFWDRDRYVRGNLFYDLAKAAMNRLAFAVSEELRPHRVTSVALSPGWMRTEIILAAFRTDEARWPEVPALARTESPRFLGRAVVALAADPGVHARTGQVLRVADLAREYGFTDVDGRQVPAFELE